VTDPLDGVLGHRTVGVPDSVPAHLQEEEKGQSKETGDAVKKYTARV